MGLPCRWRGSPRTPQPERGPALVSGYSGNLEDDSDKSSLNYNNFTPPHARCGEREREEERKSMTI